MLSHEWWGQRGATIAQEMENGETLSRIPSNPAPFFFFFFSPYKIDAAGDKHQLSKEGRRMEGKQDPKNQKINKNCAGAGEQKAKLKVSRAPGRQGNEMWS